MTPFDLLFLLCFLAAVGLVAAGLVALVRGRRPAAARRLRILGAGAALYFGALLLTSALSRQRILDLGEDNCSDDWCIAVVRANPTTQANMVRWVITFRLSSKMGGGYQRELGVIAYLVDDHGRRYDPIPSPTDTAFDVRLAPLQHLEISRSYLLPADVRGVGLITDRGTWPPNPRCCIIGEPGSLGHKRPMVVLQGQPPFPD